MPKGYPPSVFVSSTCYDLGQVRADLKLFLEGMGLDAVLSETPAFPVSPSIGPVENCVRAVRERADLFVLLVGTRYGSQTDSGKSVTNLEYLEAKAKGVPVYVFVSKQILAQLPMWKNNPNGNYSGIVDTPKLFEFVEGLRNSQDHWVFQFDRAEDVAETLRRQLPLLFMEGLGLRERVRDLKLPVALVDLPGPALRLLLERPFAWELDFLRSVLAHEIATDQALKLDLKYGLRLSQCRTLTDLLKLLQWIDEKIDHIRGLAHSFDRLFNQAIQDAIGNPTAQGDPEQIVYVARSLARVRREFLNWSIDFVCTVVDPECERLISLLSKFSTEAVALIESVPERLAAELAKATEHRASGETYTISLWLTLSEPEESNAISAEFDRLVTVFKRRLS